MLLRSWSPLKKKKRCKRTRETGDSCEIGDWNCSLKYGKQQQAACNPSYLCADLQRKTKKEKKANMEERMFEETRAARIVSSAESVGGK